MAEPVRDPETGGRSLADILREAGIENPSRGRRRRWDDDDDAGIRQRRADAEEQERAARPAYGRRAGDLPVDAPPARPGERPAERPAPPVEQRPPQPPAARSGSRSDDRDTGGFGGRVRDRGRPDGGEDRRAPRPARPAAVAAPAGDPSTAAIHGLRTSKKPGVPASTGSAAVAAPAAAPAPAAAAPAAPAPGPAGRGQRRASAPHSDPATGPIPVVGPDDGADDGAQVTPAGPGAWLRFAGELVVAAAVGVGVYFAFTVLWEMLPHLAVVASPLVVTGLVAGVGAWRQRSGRGPLGIRLLALLVFAGTVLTILPAAGLLAAA